MKTALARTILALLVAVALAEGFSLPGASVVASVTVAQSPTKRKVRPPKTVLAAATSSSSTADATPDRPLPSIVYKANSSTKWLVTLANTLGIWTRFPHYEGPFIVVGAIAATWFTSALKKVLNHDRPQGAPFTDPGMPSSHSLVSFFMAAAWGSLVCRGVGIPLVWVSASVVALLRVIVGYHSWDQIGVGALMGSSMGFAWAHVGRLVQQSYPQATLRASWAFYVAGSIVFIAVTMKEWLHKDKHI